jgi:outer membrane protein OmpA-like peptidoglycan-associated protein
MKNTLGVALVLLCATAARPQASPARNETVPIFQVTVIERTVPAINYHYRSGPTMIDFAGTVLLPHAKGEAVVEAKTGRTEVEAKFDHLTPPTKYGREYLTYVLWAVTPEGHPVNLGEVVAGGSDHAKLRVTTALQVFGLIVTAEPYGAVRQPSDVVVLENKVRPDTFGQVVEIRAKYGLLPRGHYTYERSASLPASYGERLPMDRYHALLEVYEAQNAVQIAQAMGADVYAADTFDKAQRLLAQATQMQATRADSNVVVTKAREAAEMADDARALAEHEKQALQVTQAQQEAAAAQEARARAEADAQQARADAAAARAQADAERAARERAEAESGYTPPARRGGVADRSVQEPPPQQPSNQDRVQLRARLRSDVGRVLPTLDTPRGLVLTMSDAEFRGAELRPGAYPQLARIAAIVSAYPGLRLEVCGHMDNRGSDAYAEQISFARAEMVRDLLVRDGIPPAAVVARGYGKSRPLASNDTSAGRDQNRRLEIVIAGEPIGEMAAWERTYSVAPR